MLHQPLILLPREIHGLDMNAVVALETTMQSKLTPVRLVVACEGDLFEGECDGNRDIIVKAGIVILDI